MNRLLKKLNFITAVIVLILSFNCQVHAQNSGGDLSPKTQQYIDNLNEVREAQNGGQPVNSQPAAAQSTSVWKYVFYGALSGVAYGFWRWMKKLRRGD